MRLIDDLAAKRRYYARPVPTLPNILVIDVPAAYAATTLPLGRYYPVLVETEDEGRELEHFLGEERLFLVPPTLLDRRISGLRNEDMLFAHYAPPAPGWPWLLLCCWPPAYTALVPDDPDIFARGAYTIELFETFDELCEAEATLLANLAPQEVRRIPSGPFCVGQA